MSGWHSHVQASAIRAIRVALPNPLSNTPSDDIDTRILSDYYKLIRA